MPQLIENYRTGSAEAVSLAFLVVWFVGDLANLFGALWAGLVPTVIAIAIYFCFADVILLGQCLYYNFNTSKKSSSGEVVTDDSGDPTQPLLHRRTSSMGLPGSRRRSTISRKSLMHGNLDAVRVPKSRRRSILANPWIRNALSLVTVCAIGVAGWAIAWQLGVWGPSPDEDDDNGGTDSNIGAVLLGYMSAVCYLGWASSSCPLLRWSEALTARQSSNTADRQEFPGTLV